MKKLLNLENGKDITGLNKGKCTKDQRKFFCRDIPEVPSKYYERFDFKNICVKRTKERYRDFLLNKQIIENNKKCPEGYKCCGIVDTLNRKLCMKINEQCPITIKDINSLDKNITENNTENSQILFIFKITEKRPCMIPNQKDWENVYKLEYPFKKCTKLNNQLYDFRYEKLENFVTNKFDLYDNNGIIQNYPSNTYSKLKDKKLYLYARNILGFNNEDVKEFSFDELISYETISNKHYSFILIISLFALLFLIVCLAIAKSYDLNRIFQRNETRGYLLLTLICIIIIFYLNLIVLVYNLRIQNIISVEGNDDYTKENMKLFKNEIRMHYYFNLSSLILILILIFFIILIFKNIR